LLLSQKQFRKQAFLHEARKIPEILL